jgi:purine nucleosidase
VKVFLYIYRLKDSRMKDHFVVVDTDGGCDDAMAIWLAIKAHQDPNESICVVGVVCVNGNTQLDNVTVNVARILRAVGEHGKVNYNKSQVF